jgi:hypothetical protein
MSWVDDILNDLATESHWRYRLGGPLAAEPAALAALALCGHGRVAEASHACRQLVSLASADGSVGVLADQAAPNWPTSLAILAWNATSHHADEAPTTDWRSHAERGVAWLLTVSGDVQPRNADVGHDTTLRGWPWALGTHSWVEPTALALLALKSAGLGEHIRAREAARLLVDRLLPDGGCNYGNTSVFGQLLRPHVAPSGLALAALAGENDAGGRIARTIAYLQRSLHRQSATMSLAYGLIGLAAHDRTPPAADDWLEAAAQRSGREAAPWKRTLVALAALKSDCPLFSHSAQQRVV